MAFQAFSKLCYRTVSFALQSSKTILGHIISHLGLHIAASVPAHNIDRGLAQTRMKRG